MLRAVCGEAGSTDAEQLEQACCILQGTLVTPVRSLLPDQPDVCIDDNGHHLRFTTAAFQTQSAMCSRWWVYEQRGLWVRISHRHMILNFFLWRYLPCGSRFVCQSLIVTPELYDISFLLYGNKPQDQWSPYKRRLVRDGSLIWLQLWPYNLWPATA